MDSLRYSLTPDDCVAVAEYHAAHGRRHRWSFVFNAVVGSALVVLVCVAFGVTRRPAGWIAVGVAIVGWMLYLPWRLRTGNRRHFRRVCAEAEKRGRLGPQHMTVDAEGFTLRTGSAEVRMRWPAIDRIVTEPAFTLLYVGEDNAFVIPRARVVEGDYEAFVERSRRLHAEAGGGRPR
ncbi:MAG TPA: YcxB family protein [Longimicrobiales bacterium]|nr:YcxB family protein [Longimicrobiales bacterium]